MRRAHKKLTQILNFCKLFFQKRNIFSNWLIALDVSFALKIAAHGGLMIDRDETNSFVGLASGRSKIPDAIHKIRIIKHIQDVSANNNISPLILKKAPRIGILFFVSIEWIKWEVWQTQVVIEFIYFSFLSCSEVEHTQSKSGDEFVQGGDLI